MILTPTLSDAIRLRKLIRKSDKSTETWLLADRLENLPISHNPELAKYNPTYYVLNNMGEWDHIFEGEEIEETGNLIATAMLVDRSMVTKIFGVCFWARCLDGKPIMPFVWDETIPTKWDKYQSKF